MSIPDSGILALTASSTAAFQVTGEVDININNEDVG